MLIHRAEADEGRASEFTAALEGRLGMKVDVFGRYVSGSHELVKELQSPEGMTRGEYMLITPFKKVESLLATKPN